MKIKFRLKKLIVFVMSFLICVTSLGVANVFAWTTQEGQICSSNVDGYFLGSDGYYYSEPARWCQLYNDDGSSFYYYINYSGYVYKFRMTLANGESRRAYCLETGASYRVASNNYISNSVGNNSYFNNLPYAAQQGILFASLYGYQEGKSSPIGGTNVDDYGAATQIIIWEYQQGLRTSPTSLQANGVIPADTYYNMIRGRPAEYCYNWILNQIALHGVLPSFTSRLLSSAPTYTLKYNISTKKYSLTVEDTNNTLSNLNIESSTGISVSRNGNKYTFTSDNMITSAVGITLGKNTYTTTEGMLLWGHLGGTYQTMATGVSDPLKFFMKIKTETYGKCKIVKTSEDGNVSGINFTIEGNGISKKVTTGSDGTILVEGLLPGNYTVTEEGLDKYVPQSTRTITIYSESTSEVPFSNVLKKWRVSVTKQDAQTSAPQGDASLEGAVYGLYKNDVLVDTYTTDSKGQFTTGYYACGDDWSIKEISPSKGYQLDVTQYHIGAEAKTYSLEYNSTTVKAYEDVIKGKVQLVKHLDQENQNVETDGESGGNLGIIEEPEEGAVFQIYLKSSVSFENAKTSERDLITTDEDGYAVSKDLPYGIYVLHQVSGIAGKGLIPDFYVNLVKNDKTYKYILNNTTPTSKIRIEKSDLETGKLINSNGVAFKILDLEGNYLTMHYDYPTPTDADVFYTNNQGWLVLPESLPLGDYTLEEVQTAFGYTLGNEKVSFRVDGSESTVTVKKYNDAQKGIIKIIKSGEVFESVIKNQDIYQPVYKIKGLEGAVYEVVAAEDIYTLDGTLRVGKGEVVDTITTDENGCGESYELYLGKYLLQEVVAPYGMVIDSSEYEVVLDYDSQEIETVEKTVTLSNERQKAKISLVKKLEETSKLNLGKDIIKEVSYGLYAAEDIISEDGAIIPKDGLIEIMYSDEKGLVKVVSDLPFGKYYFKELTTNENYLLDEKKYFVTFDYETEDLKVVEVVANDGKAIINKLKDIPEEKITPAPKTGDEMETYLWILLITAFLSSGLLIAIVVISKKKNE